MTEAAVFGLLSNFAPDLREELNLLTGVQEDIEYIRAEFERMTHFLRVADAIEDRDPNLKVWVKQVREAAYDTADALDMYMLRLKHDDHSIGFRNFLPIVSFFIRTVYARNQIASEVKRIKSRIINISEGHQRYSEMYGKIEQGSSSTYLDIAWYDCRGDALLLQEADLVGIDKPKLQLIQWLVNEDPRLKVLSVAGMGGLGKTTLAKKVYDDTTVNRHFQNHVWITVSESFKVEELLKNMIQVLFEEVRQPLPQEVDNMDANSLKGIINAFLQQKRYVLVLDDVWNIYAWQVLRIILPECNCGSRVILTTRNVDLASFASEEYHGMVYNLKPLPPKESWALFCSKTFKENSCPSYLEGLSKKILGKCEGLPLAIVAISGLLSTKEKSADDWERIYRGLGAELEGNDKLMSMKKILSLSYYDLPYYLKLCFLYLSIFPEDCLIDHWRLIRLWVAEGFIEVKEGMTKEEVAEGYLNELMNRSLVQVTHVAKDGRFKAYRIHDLWREMIIAKSREQNIVTIASERGREWPEKLRHLSVHHNLDDILQNICFTRLRSLIVFSITDSMSILSKVACLGNGVRLLTVLDLSGAQLETFPHEIVELLNLTYLSLRATNVKMIPKAIGKLKKLETLDLKHTNVTELPDEILELQHLRHLLVYRYDVHCYYPFHGTIGFKAPAGIGSLLYLQKLCAIEANRGSNSGIVLREVGKLAQLRRLVIVKLQKEDGMVLCSSLERLDNLRTLEVIAKEEDEIIDLDSLTLPPQLLRTLYLRGRLEKIPHWIPSLHNLKILQLGWSKLKDVDPLQSLQYLPNLLHLGVLVTAYEGDGLFFKAGGFQKLKELCLVRLGGLKWVRVESSSMPLLQKFILQDCKLMMELPSGVEHMANLKDLELYDMSKTLISRLKRDLQGGDYWKIAHVPNVWVANSKSGYWIGRHL
ncbi:disease resistance protein RPM1-like isoform X2 [Rhododendron vialii]|uniref:disease resistance protein RPM1-like isoform X2 n=1 Tax=Rhododendron vialii TaxID=182163 RepID=UPI00265F6BDF|nr:disease resistance protein RPM1-like isoform X2 [Rhododendron vialii]